jgi:hypothetical protein
MIHNSKDEKILMIPLCSMLIMPRIASSRNEMQAFGLLAQTV